MLSARSLWYGDQSCTYWLGTPTTSELTELLVPLRPSRFLIVCDKEVAALYGTVYADELSGVVPTHLLVHDSEEEAKTLATVEQFGDEAQRFGADRAAVILALGGGLSSNLAGLLAALLYRGVRLVHLPTTLLAMVDSVFSLKQGVNSNHGKNAFGGYHRPSLIVADTRHLTTLPPTAIRSGMCEVIKNALAIAPNFIGSLDTLLRDDADYTTAQIEQIIDFALVSKQSLLKHDPYERSAALACEYGHTAGHAIEHVYGVPHGLAIGIGMLVAAEIAFRRGLLDSEGLAVHYELLANNGGLADFVLKLNVEAILKACTYDNKRGYIQTESKEVAMVLLEALGQPFESEPGLPLVPVKLEELRDAAIQVKDRWQELCR
jgi:3-dehydroquinate synthase/2-deoxy-scyllo-inosose synthase